MQGARNGDSRCGRDRGRRERHQYRLSPGLLVFTPPEYSAHLEANLAMMRRVGVNTRTISPQEAQELDPSLWTGDVTQVAYEPESGYVDPNATIYSLARASSDLGVTF